MREEPTLVWAETDAGEVWRSTCGRYAIVGQTLPERPPRVVYQARKIDPAMAAAHPERGTLGYLLEESPWAWTEENNVRSAEAICQRDAYGAARDMSFPRDYPAIAMERFGVGHGEAVAVVWDGGDVLVRVLGMGINSFEEGFVPQAHTEINLTGLGLVAHDAADLTTTTDHGPEPCGNCGVKLGQPHDTTCAFAICRVTGEQRLLCERFGDAPIAGLVTFGSGGSEEEFETYFKAPVDHDCGEDIFVGEGEDG